MISHWQPNIYVFASLFALISAYTIALFVYLRGRQVPAAKPFILLCLCGGFWCFFPTLTSLPFSDGTILTLARLTYFPAGFTLAAFLHLAFAITGDERYVLRRQSLLIAYGLAGLFAVLTVSPYYIIGVIRHAPHFAAIGGPIYHLLVVFYVISATFAMVVTVRNLRFATGNEKNRLRYFAVASGILGLSPLLHFLGFYFRAEPVPHDFLVPAFVGIVAYAIMRHQLMDIQVVFRRSLVYSLLVATLTAVYLVMVLIMEKWFQGFFGYRSIFATAIVAFLIAIFFNPLRSGIQTLVDRALFKATPPELAAQREQLLGEVRKSEQMKAVATLAAGLAHEIRNPLASIKTFMDYLPARHTDPEFLAKFQKIVGSEVERINRSVQQLLEFAKPMPPKLTPLSLPSLIDETLEFLNGELLAHHIEVHRDYAAQETILGDPQQLKQVFLNLVLNSLQAMDGQGRLEVRTSQKASELLITLTDTGSGIAPEDLPHIFDPFFTTKPRGTGLGLAVVQGIIKEHGGRISVESQVGQGTRVTFALPVAV